MFFFSHKSKDRLADLVAEHLDHLHYLNDILCLDISDLNHVLCDHLLNNLFLPLYVFSLSPLDAVDARLKDYPRIDTVVSLFLLSQVGHLSRLRNCRASYVHVFDVATVLGVSHHSSRVHREESV